MNLPRNEPKFDKNFALTLMRVQSENLRRGQASMIAGSSGQSMAANNHKMLIFSN